MKKLLLFTSLALFAISLQAQTFDFLNGEYEVYEASGFPENEQLAAHVDVKNVSDQEVTVIVSREIVTDNVTGYEEQFCWGGICYQVGEPQSLVEQDIEPGEVIASDGLAGFGFTAYYKYLGNEGLTTIKYWKLEMKVIRRASLSISVLETIALHWLELMKRKVPTLNSVPCRQTLLADFQQFNTALGKCHKMLLS